MYIYETIETLSCMLLSQCVSEKCAVTHFIMSLGKIQASADVKDLKFINKFFDREHLCALRTSNFGY